jgi:hypothetical protein
VRRHSFVLDKERQEQRYRFVLDKERQEQRYRFLPDKDLHGQQHRFVPEACTSRGAVSCRAGVRKSSGNVSCRARTHEFSGVNSFLLPEKDKGSDRRSYRGRHVHVSPPGGFFSLFSWSAGLKQASITNFFFKRCPSWREAQNESPL